MDSNAFYKDLRAAIDRFREESGGLRPKFPPEIRERAAAAATELGIQPASQILGVSNSALVRWKREAKGSKPRSKSNGTPPQFVELPRASSERAAALSISQPAAATVTIKTVSGLIFTVDVGVPAKYVVELLAGFTQCSP